MDHQAAAMPLRLAMRRRLDAVLASHEAVELPDPAERKRLRLEAGLSLRELAAVVGVSHMAISRYENGTREVAQEVRPAYAEALRMLAEVAA
jgi:predicted transcriptional regulator